MEFEFLMISLGFLRLCWGGLLGLNLSVDLLVCVGVYWFGFGGWVLF